MAIAAANSRIEPMRRDGKSFIQYPNTPRAARLAWPASGGWKLMPKRA